MRVNQIYPTTTTVQNGTYDFWRKIYFNASGGFDQAALNNNAELALGQYESNTTSMTALTSTYGFFDFGHSPNGGGNAPFCEDFDEQLIGTSGTNSCNGVSTNTNACNFNLNAQQPSANTAMPSATLPNSSPIPSDPSSNPALSTTSTVCGNGISRRSKTATTGSPARAAPSTVATAAPAIPARSPAARSSRDLTFDPIARGTLESAPRKRGAPFFVSASVPDAATTSTAAVFKMSQIAAAQVHTLLPP